MFIDEAEIYVKAGNGGNGAVSFRREKYIANGGPDGGDGGRGGDIIFRVTELTHGLSSYNRGRKFLAENGQNGMSSNKSGKNGADLVLDVPPGTQIFKGDELILDLQKIGDSQTFLHGGNGGWGNQHFATSIKQAPKWAKTGMRGESAKIRLVLKLIADVGLIGLPNAGKSTLISVITSAKPKIADYPFTTLEPNLGTLIDSDSRIIIADIPGLIAGASLGKGLGDKFLRHIERTKVLIHLLSADSADLGSDYKTIRDEIALFSKELVGKPEAIVINKADLVSEAELDKKIKALNLKTPPVVISAVTHKNIAGLINKIKGMLNS